MASRLSPRRRIVRLTGTGRLRGLVLMAPAALFVASVVGMGLVLAVYVSFTDSSAGSLSGRFVGWLNFERAFSDATFRKSVGNTVIISLVAPAVAVLPAVVLAHFLSRDFRGKWALLTVILLPWAAPAALEAMGWRWIFDSLFSVLNWSLQALHVIDARRAPQWLGDPTLAMVSVIAVHAWRLLPFAALVTLSGLSSIPSEVYDAAAVDGAVGWRRLVHVTIPFLLPVIGVTVLFGIVFTATGMAVVYVLTQGGPFNSTHVTPSWAYQVGISSNALGQGAAISLYVLPLLAVISVLILSVVRKIEFE